MASTKNMGNRTKIEGRDNAHKGTLHMVIEITGSNFMENKVAIEADSPCITAI